MDPVTFSCAEMSTRELNSALADLPDGTSVRVVEPWGRHNIAVGLTNRISIEIEGNAGYFTGGLGEGPEVTVSGFVGWSTGENLMGGTIRVLGNASECTGASAHGGTIVVHGDASSRTAISLKGASVLVAGDVGHMSGFMAQAGVLLIGGNAGNGLGDSLYETVIYVAGSIASLGADARVEELTESDVKAVRDLVDLARFDHIDPDNVSRVASARELYNFDALTEQRY